MKKEHWSNLRSCEKIRQHECFIEVDGLAKKIRKMDNPADKVIDAEAKMREIQFFYKEGWEYDHVHSTYLATKIVRPTFYLRNAKSVEFIGLERYYELMQSFINKFRIEHEDQTDFKIEVKQLDGQCTMEPQGNDETQIANLALDHLLTVMKTVSAKMIESFDANLKICEWSMQGQTLQQSHKSYLQFTEEVCSRMIEGDITNKKYNATQFMKLVMETMEKAKTSKLHSSVLAVQPELGQLTYFIHPLLLSLYSRFAYEVLEKQAKLKRGKVYVDEYDKKLILDKDLLRQRFLGTQLLPIRDASNDEDRHSKVIFLNLDGYESQFNLEVARNFSKNLMYVSFPKFENRDVDEIYNKRMHKKIMYYSTKNETEVLDPDKQMELDATQIKENPEDYHWIIDQIYAQILNKKPCDLNERLFVFPLNLDLLRSEKMPPQDQKDVQLFESHLVRYILRDHLYAQMREFRASFIMISYTGHIQIENPHFLEIIQELVKICPQIILFPNFTAPIIEDSMMQRYENYPLTKAYDKIFSSIGRGIIMRETMGDIYKNLLQFYTNESFNPAEVDLMDKLSIFLKVTAGHYNVIRPYEEEEFHIRYKTSQMLGYISHLYTALKSEYGHCERRDNVKSMEVSKANVDQKVKHHSKELERCIPNFYKQLFREFAGMLQGQIKQSSYSLELLELRDRYQSNTELMSNWSRIEKCQRIMLSNSKYHEISYIQIRQKSSSLQYEQLKDQKMSCLDSTYRLTFSYIDTIEVAKIYKDVSLLFEVDQRFSKGSFYVILSNLFNPDETEIQLYLSKPKLGNKKVQHCQIAPISFYNRQGQIRPKSQFKVWTEWSYSESQDHLILYWPQEFDFFAYYLRKMVGKRYEPKVLNSLFVANKSTDQISKGGFKFYEVIIEGDSYLPRWGCSGFSSGGQFYIFGGFYERQFSYLNLQNDISTISLADFDPQSFTPKKLFNLRKELYCGEAFYGKLRESKDVNTFVRPRMQFQFYDYDQLLIPVAEQTMADQDRRKVIMIGGFGQDFKTPYSIFVNYYYELQFQRVTNRLVSIKKRYVKNKVISVNIKEMMRNRGVFQKSNILSLQSENCRQGMTNNSHYFGHRVVYAIVHNELYSRIKNLFAVELFDNCKRDFYNFAKQIGEIREEDEPETISIRKMGNNKHQLLVFIGESFKIIYSLYFQYLQLGQSMYEEVPLADTSIIAIDTRKLTVFALINHSKYTKGKAVLAIETVQMPESSILQSQKHCVLVLKRLHVFQGPFNLHTLIICNQSEVALLHGLAFEHSSAYEYLIKAKSQSEIETKEIIRPKSASREVFSTISSFFYKKMNVIHQVSILEYCDDSSHFCLMQLAIDIQKFKEGWKEISTREHLRFIYKEVALRRVNFEVKLGNSEDPNCLSMLIHSHADTYFCKLQQGEKISVQLLKNSKEFRIVKNMNNLNSVVKMESLYLDYGYQASLE